MRIGAWIDGPHPRKGSVDKWAASIRAAGITVARIVTNAGVKPYHLPRWRPELLGQAVKALQALDVEVWLMVWPIATSKGVEELVASLPGLLSHATPTGIEFDAEGNHNSIGWGKAGVELSIKLARLLKDEPTTRSLKMGVTAIPPVKGVRAQDRALMRALTDAGYHVTGAPQAYSQYQSKAWTHNAMFRPGPIQRHSAEQWLSLLDEGLIADIHFGLMAGFQNHPKPSPTGREALEVALSTAASSCGDRVDTYIYWSWKAIKGRKSTISFLKHASGDSAYTLEPMPRRLPVAELQARLVAMGYQLGRVDGKAGPRTLAALGAYRDDASFAPIEWADPTIEQLAAEASL